MSGAPSEVRKRDSLARAACLIGGVFDGLMLVPMLVPDVGARLFRLPHFAPGPDYRYAMHVAASLMLGWTLLLFWAARRPAERAPVLLLTVVVICGLALAGSAAVVSGFLALASIFPVFLTQLGLAGLFLVAYRRIRARQVADDSKP